MVVALHKLFLAEQLPEVTAFVGFLYDALEFAVGKHLVTGDIDFVNLHLLMLVNIDVHNHLVLLGEVLLKIYLDIGVAETFFLKILLDNGCGAVHDVLRDLIALHEVQTLLQVLTLTLFHAVVFHLRDAGLSAEIDKQPHFVAGHLLHDYLSLGKEALTHKALHCRGDIVTGNLDTVAFLQSRISYHDIILIIVGTGHPDVGNLIGRRKRRIDNGGIIDCVDTLLRIGKTGEEQ